ncbi:MAG: FAD-dependent monooxygenase, partial [Microcystaceae cyanobacterium]
MIEELAIAESEVETDSQAITVDVAIVGGGIVGLTLASALRKSGLAIAVIEALPTETALKKPQAYALSLLSGKILKGIGLWEQIEPQLGKFKQIRLSDGDYQTIVPFEHQDLQTDYLGYVGEHQTILSALQHSLDDNEHLQWFRPAEVVAVDYQTEQAVLTIRTEAQEITVNSKLVIGADGARSPIRTGAGIKTRGWKYWQSCVTFTVKHQLPRNDIAFERFCDRGPMGVLPLQGDRCQIVWTLPQPQAHQMTEISVTEF